MLAVVDDHQFFGLVFIHLMSALLMYFIYCLIYSAPSAQFELLNLSSFLNYVFVSSISSGVFIFSDIFSK